MPERVPKNDAQPGPDLSAAVAVAGVSDPSRAGLLRERKPEQGVARPADGRFIGSASRAPSKTADV
jgi:hypothetical protein